MLSAGRQGTGELLAIFSKITCNRAGCFRALQRVSVWLKMTGLDQPMYVMSVCLSALTFFVKCSRTHL